MNVTKFIHFYKESFSEFSDEEIEIFKKLILFAMENINCFAHGMSIENLNISTVNFDEFQEKLLNLKIEDVNVIAILGTKDNVFLYAFTPSFLSILERGRYEFN